MKLTLALLFLGLVVFATAFPKSEETQQTEEEDQDEALADEKEIQEGKQTKEADLLVGNALQDEQFDGVSLKENAEADGKEIVKRGSMRHLILCENQSTILRCPHRQRINVYYANYGRRHGGHVCPHRQVNNTKCYSAYANRVIRCACSSRQYCRLYADNKNFGDPCRGIQKYIEVAYKCS